ncbi:hypothetical protein E3E22_10560 [Thermococcus sp. MV5]|uniref:hypothetical protein n=1 Tax=Thermococcus sp. MV5 TaxID=1638272 RepID=UPI00143C55A2|nr:hypothetical protein [Thermococcus sp. MV5]NJE27042.1 hypothetical protein [Thermococcus sp. MV5]
MSDEEIRKAFERIAKAIKEHEEEKKRILSNIDLNKVSKEELIEVLYDVLFQDCYNEDTKEGFSHCFSCYARGLRLLAKLGLFEITVEKYRYVRGKFKGW